MDQALVTVLGCRQKIKDNYIHRDLINNKIHSITERKDERLVSRAWVSSR